MTFAKRALHMRHLPSPTRQPREVVLLCPHFTGTQGTKRWGWPQALEEMAEPTRRTTVPAHTKGGVLTCEEPVVWQTPGQGRVATRWSLPQLLSSPTGAWAAPARAPAMGCVPQSSGHTPWQLLGLARE